jgi:hypothetical protein
MARIAQEKKWGFFWLAVRPYQAECDDQVTTSAVYMAFCGHANRRGRLKTLDLRSTKDGEGRILAGSIPVSATLFS